MKEARLKSRLEWASRKSKRERLTLTLVLRKLERKKLRKREVVKVVIGGVEEAGERVGPLIQIRSSVDNG